MELYHSPGDPGYSWDAGTQARSWAEKTHEGEALILFSLEQSCPQALPRSSRPVPRPLKKSFSIVWGRELMSTLHAHPAQLWAPNPPPLTCPGGKGNTISKSVLLLDCLREAAGKVEPRRTETQASSQPTPLPPEPRISEREAHCRAGGTEAGVPPEPAFSRTQGPGHRPAAHECIRLPL